jgi:hypothetical protein
MVDFASTQTWAKRVAPSTNREGGQTEAAVSKPLKTSAPPTADGVDRLYCQLAEIYAIAATHLAECARWHRSDPTPSLVRVGTSCQKPTTTPFIIRMAPSPPTDFSSRVPLRQQGRRIKPEACRQACNGSMGTQPEIMRGTHPGRTQQYFQAHHRGVAQRRHPLCHQERGG